MLVISTRSLYFCLNLVLHEVNDGVVMQQSTNVSCVSHINFNDEFTEQNVQQKTQDERLSDTGINLLSLVKMKGVFCIP